MALAKPTIVTAAAASPSPVTATSTALSVLGTDQSLGEGSLTYTWTTTGATACCRQLLDEWQQCRQIDHRHVYEGRHVQLPGDDQRFAWEFDYKQRECDGSAYAAKRGNQPCRGQHHCRRHAAVHAGRPGSVRPGLHDHRPGELAIDGSRQSRRQQWTIHAALRPGVGDDPSYIWRLHHQPGNGKCHRSCRMEFGYLQHMDQRRRKDSISGGTIAAPGMRGILGDTVLFASVIGSTVSLSGANPTLAGITFDNATTSYTIAQGGSGSITLQSGAGLAVVAGSHTIAAPLTLWAARTSTSHRATRLPSAKVFPCRRPNEDQRRDARYFPRPITIRAAPWSPPAR